MLLRLHPRRDDQAALVFDDVASALDAGLPLHTLGADAAAGERALHGLFAARGVTLDATEDEILAAAWSAGRAAATLRRLAESRRAQAAFARDLFGRVRYPLAVVAMALVTSTIIGLTIPGAGGILAFAAPTAVVAIAVFVLLLRAIARGDERLVRLPLLSGWAADLAELPYLEVLGGLYASGVPLLAAHPRAVAACPVADVRQRLGAADAILQQRRPLAEALTQANALHRETRQLLAIGEQSGELEQAMMRALQRRRDVAGRATATLCRTMGNVAYAFGLLLTVAVVFSAYGAMFARIR